MILQKFDLSDSEVEDIKKKNATLIALRNLCQEVTPGNQNIDLLISKLSTAQLEYDEWFGDMQTAKNIVTFPTNRWNVDFSNKSLQVLDK